MAKQFIYAPSYVQVMRRSSAGYPMGQLTSPDSPANDTTTHAYLMKNVISFQGSEPSRVIATDLGGQKIRAQVDMGIESFGSGTLTLSERDDVFEALVLGGAVDASTPSGWRQSGSNVNQVVLPALFLVITTKAQVIDDTTTPPTISPKWTHFVFPNCQISKGASSAAQGGGANPNPLTYTITPNISYRDLTGRPFSATAMSLTDDSDLSYVIQSNNPLGITTYTANAANPETFTLGYRPLTAHGVTTDKLLTQNGVADTIVSLSTSTGVLTTATGTAGDIFVIVYETVYQAI